jgi:acetyl esterase/lipase
MVLQAQNARADVPVELLWPNGAPGAIGTEASDQPVIKVFMPDAGKSTGTGIIICTGGSFQLIMSYEGEHVAQWLNTIGVTAFVLRYRLAQHYHYLTPGEDVLRAIRVVRYNAARYQLSSDHIGIMGFSAGGHLASTAATHFNEGTLNAKDPVDTVSSRPDFAILAYPVISMREGETAITAARNLFGTQDTPAAREHLTNYLHVTDQTPPIFLFFTSGDNIAVENSLLFYNALRQHHVPTEMHIFEKGSHGVGLADGDCNGDDPKLCRAVKDPYLAEWTKLAENWLRMRGLLTPKPPTP